jgi:lipid-binding SYLF domain-containing protein
LLTRPPTNRASLLRFAQIAKRESFEQDATSPNGGNMKNRMRIRAVALMLAPLLVSLGAPFALAASREELERNAAHALQNLYASDTAAKLIGPKAKGILVFPNIIKAGFMFGGQVGDGVLTRNGKLAGFYNSLAASYGLQAGAQVFGYALFFMNEKALTYLDASDGWEIGVGPSIVVLDKGAGKSFTSSMITEDVYAFIFDQKGLMAGIGIQGSKISKISK